MDNQPKKVGFSDLLRSKYYQVAIFSTFGLVAAHDITGTVVLAFVSLCFTICAMIELAHQ